MPPEQNRVMPSGPLEGVPLLVNVLLATSPRRILDLGMGTGKWGFLLREQHDLTQGRWELRIDGVEGYEPYIHEHQRAIYDAIVVSDVREYVAECGAGEYDIALVLDLIEHFPPAIAREFISDTLRVAHVVAIATPKRFYPQTEHPNELEHHKSWWPMGALRRLATECQAAASITQLRMTNLALLSRSGKPPPLNVGRLADAAAHAKDRLIPERFYYRVLGKTGPTI
jgi:hypothetical protein